MDSALKKPADLRRKIAWSRKWVTPWRTLAFGALYALVSLVGVGLLTRAQSLVSEPAGSIVMLVIVFYQSGELTCFSLNWVFGMRVASELDYRVYWPRPIDSTWVRPALRAQAQNEFMRGLSVTSYIIVVVVLLTLESPLLLPAIALLLFTGYAAVFASIVAYRRCVHHIVAHAKEARLAELRTRIDIYGEQLTELDKAQFDELTRLLTLYDIIDRSPTNLSVFDVVTRFGASLAVPTVTFVITVVAQEYFGRLAGGILP